MKTGISNETYYIEALWNGLKEWLTQNQTNWLELLMFTLSFIYPFSLSTNNYWEPSIWVTIILFLISLSYKLLLIEKLNLFLLTVTWQLGELIQKTFYLEKWEAFIMPCTYVLFEFFSLHLCLYWLRNIYLA